MFKEYKYLTTTNKLKLTLVLNIIYDIFIPRNMDDRETALYKLTRTMLTPKEIKKLVNTYKFSFKEGRYSSKEMNIVHRMIIIYMKKYGIKKEALEEWAVYNKVSDGFDIKDLCSQITDTLKYRTYRSVYSMLNHICNPYLNQKFTPDSDRELLALVAKEGHQWKKYEPVLEKYRKASIWRYNMLMNRHQKHVTIDMLLNLNNSDLPKTEFEYQSLATSTGLPIDKIKKKIKSYIKGREFDVIKNHRHLIDFCLFILNYNFPSRINIDIDKINHDITEFENNISKGDISTFINETIVNNSKVNLDIPIEKHDIFWNILHQQFGIENSDLWAKYHELQSEYNWKTYKDIFNTVKTILNEYFEDKKTQYYIDLYSCKFIDEHWK